jgi:asparagine synthase (glutamine-hydrolysing)
VPIRRAYTAFFTDIDHAENLERTTAAATAKHFGIDHMSVPIHGAQVRDHFWQIVRSLGQPYGGSIPSWFLYEAVSREFKVCLTGTGGDELFGQYGKWVPIAERVVGRIPKDQSWRLGSATRYAMKRSAYRFGRHFMPASRRHTLARQFAPTEDWASAYPVSAFPAAFRTREVPSTRGYLLREMTDAEPLDDTARWMTDLELRSQLPGEFLVVTDRLSMAHSVEARVPFLDQEFVSLIQEIPGIHRLTRTDPKWLLREAFHNDLSAAVINAPKRGFTDPVATLLRGILRPLAYEILEEADNEVISALDLNVVALRSWLEGGDPSWAGYFWRVMMILAWWSTTTSD